MQRGAAKFWIKVVTPLHVLCHPFFYSGFCTAEKVTCASAAGFAQLFLASLQQVASSCRILWAWVLLPGRSHTGRLTPLLSDLDTLLCLCRSSSEGQSLVAVMPHIFQRCQPPCLASVHQPAVRALHSLVKTTAHANFKRHQQTESTEKPVFIRRCTGLQRLCVVGWQLPENDEEGGDDPSITDVGRAEQAPNLEST